MAQHERSVLYMVHDNLKHKDMVLLNEEYVVPRKYVLNTNEFKAWILENGISNHMIGKS